MTQLFHSKMDSIDPNVIMNLNIWHEMVIQKELEKKNEHLVRLEIRKKEIFPLLETFFMELSTHNHLTLAPPDLYWHEKYYLEKQFGLGCWAHVLGVILGCQFHSSIRTNSGITAMLMAFCRLGDGDSDNIEPCWLTTPGEEGQTITDIKNIFGVEDNATYSFVSGMGTFQSGNPPQGSIMKFIQILNARFFSNGLTTVDAHRLFISLNNPIDSDDEETNPYKGAVYLGTTEITSELSLIDAFADNDSNIIVLSHRLSRDSYTLHYAIFWKIEERKEIFFFDSRHGIFEPAPGQAKFSDYSMPKFPEDIPDLRYLLFNGDFRCAYYFKVCFNDAGVVHERTVATIIANMNTRIKAILQQYFKLQHQFQDITFIQLPVPVERRFVLPDNINLKWSNRQIAVFRSGLRNARTGNTLGYGVHLISGIGKDNVIGKFTGQVKVYTRQELRALADQCITNQFYTLELQLNSDAKRKYRLKQGNDWEQKVEYMAYLDCTEAAKNGQCLISYSNSPNGCYTFYGSQKVVANAKLSIRPGSIKPSLVALVALVDLPAGTEILWKYNGLTLPTTATEEQYSKVHPEDFGSDWNYPFQREQFISFIRCSMKEDKRRAGIQMLTEAMKKCDADSRPDKLKNAEKWYGDFVRYPPCYSYEDGKFLTQKHFASHRPSPIDPITKKPNIPVRNDVF